jgi:LIM domain
MKSALSPAQWAQLREYMFEYNVRYFSATTDPSFRTSENFGLTNDGFSVAPAGTTVAFQNVPGFDFFGVNAATSSVQLSVATGYYRAGVDSASSNNVTVLTRHDNHSADVALAYILFENRREELHSMFLTSLSSLSDGVKATLWVPWLTRGLFLGQRRQLLQTFVGDIYFYNLVTLSGKYFNLRDSDFAALTAKYGALKASLPAGSTAVKPALGFRGRWSGYNPGLRIATQTPIHRSHYYWVNQLYSSGYDLYETSDAQVEWEISQNIDFAADVLFTDLPGLPPDYASTVMATSSGNNASISDYFLTRDKLWLQAAPHGIDAAIGDNFVPMLAPEPGLPYRARVMNISFGVGRLVLPGFPCGLDVEASTAAEQVNASGGGQTIAQIIDSLTDYELNQLAGKLRHDYVRFTQPHLNRYDFGISENSLFSLWIEAYVAKYNRHWTLPLLSVDPDDLKNMFLARRARDDCGLSAIAHVEGCDVVSVSVSSSANCTASLTGAYSSSYASTDYGPEHTLHIPMAGGTEKITLWPRFNLGVSCDLSWVNGSRFLVLPSTTGSTGTTDVPTTGIVTSGNPTTASTTTDSPTTTNSATTGSAATTGASTNVSTSSNTSNSNPVTGSQVPAVSSDAEKSFPVLPVVFGVVFGCLVAVVCAIIIAIHHSGMNFPKKKDSRSVADDEESMTTATSSGSSSSVSSGDDGDGGTESSAETQPPVIAAAIPPVAPERSCETCSEPVAGKHVEVHGKMFHPGCFRCANCDTVLKKTKGGVKAHHDEFWCSKCVEDHGGSHRSQSKARKKLPTPSASESESDESFVTDETANESSTSSSYSSS